MATAERTVDQTAERAPMRADLALSLGVLLAIFASLLPLLTVLKPGAWLPAAVLLTAIVLAAGYFGRRMGLRALVVSLIEILLWALFLTFVFFRDTALLWLIPTPATAREVPDALAEAFQDITLGSAPMTVSAELAFLIVGATALLAIIVDHVVLTARMPLLAGVGLIAVSLIPSIVVPQGVDIMAFALLAGAVLYLIRTETRSRDLPAAREASRAAGVPATALGIGAIAIVVAIVVTPLLPPPTPIVAGQPGLGQGIDVTLQLGDDLRQPRITEALRLHTDAPAPPYLRAATLSVFTGAIWQPDRMRAVPLDSDNALSEVAVTSGVKVSEFTTDVEVRELVASWLPVAFPAVAVTGLDGSWKVVPYNRTVLSQSGSTRGQTYQVVTHVPRPTLEQIRATEAGGPQIRDDTTALPPDMPPIIAETAAAVTAGAETDYDELIALQRWFRGSDFRYSLKAPVEEGFDGSGTDAVAKFLEVKQGYCVHFASAFALMARTLGMPSRIVVGYLPGNPTTEQTAGADRRADRRADHLFGVQQPAARLARGVLQRHRLGAVRAHRRPRRADQLLSGIDDARRSRPPGPTSPRRRAPRHRGRPRIPWMTDSMAHRPRAAPRSPGSTRCPRSASCSASSSPCRSRPFCGPSADDGCCGRRATAMPPRRGRWCRTPRSTSASRHPEASRPARWPRVWSASMGHRPSRCESS